MTQLPEEAVEAVGAALVKNLKCGTSFYVLAEAAATAALPAIEKQIRAEVAAEIRVEMRRHDTAQIGFSAIGDAYAHAARIAEGSSK